jgi:hypothetical protein
VDLTQRLQRAFAGATGELVTTAILYAAAAGVLWVAFYVLFRGRLAHRKVGPKVPDRPQWCWSVPGTG